MNNISAGLFKDFANVWTAVGYASELKADRPLPLVVAGEHLVLFRDAQIKPVALIDRCPHRGVKLSLGQVTNDGRLACPFHGWEFGHGGACEYVPFNPAAKRQQLCATSLPTHEAAGILWVYTAPIASAPELPFIDDTLTSPEFAHTPLSVNWACHWTRAMENMLDTPHLPYVHRTTIGAGIKKRMTRDSQLTMTWVDDENGGIISSQLDNDPPQQALRFMRPNRMALYIDPPGKRLRMHVFCVPTEANRTRMMILGSRDFMTWAPLDWLLNRMNARIALQDQAIVESSAPVEIPPASEERSVATDRPTLQFRRYYFSELKGSVARVGGAAAPSDENVGLPH